MKKIILIIAFISISVLSKAQDLPYRSLSEFNKDTTAFIIYNFIDRADYYRGKTIKEVTKDLRIPINNYFNLISDGVFIGISIKISEIKEICIYWEGEIKIDSREYKAYQEERRMQRSQDPEYYNYIKSLRINDLDVNIPDSKGKNKKNKISNRRVLRFSF